MKNQILIAALFASCAVFAQADFNAGWSIQRASSSNFRVFEINWIIDSIPPRVGLAQHRSTISFLSGRNKSAKALKWNYLRQRYSVGKLDTVDGVYMTVIVYTNKIPTTYVSDTMFFTPCDIIVDQAKPSNLTKIPASGGTLLSWSAPPSTNVIGYRVVYGSRSSNLLNLKYGTLTSDTSLLIPDQSHGLSVGNYNWSVQTRYINQAGQKRTSQKACPVTMAINSNGNVGNKTDLTDHGATPSSSRVYPNPAIDNLYIQTAVGSNVRVVDIQGRTVYFEVSNAAELNLNISDWTNGVYMVMIENNGELDTHKVVKH